MKIFEVTGVDDVGQKIYKGNTTRVVHTPVADKNISTLDQRVDKFARDRDRDNATYTGAKVTMPGTNELIAKSRSNIRQAYNKQDAVDARQGAGQSYITKGKPVRFDPKNSSSNIKLAMDSDQSIAQQINWPNANKKPQQQPKQKQPPKQQQGPIKKVVNKIIDVLS